MEPAYRVYFWSATSTLVGREEFEASDDDTAMAIAETLCDACSDVSDSYELWRGARVIAVRSIGSPKRSATMLNAKTQAAVVEHEERLLDSKWAIAKSRRLLERLPRQTTRPSLPRWARSLLGTIGFKRPPPRERG